MPPDEVEPRVRVGDHAAYVDASGKRRSAVVDGIEHDDPELGPDDVREGVPLTARGLRVRLSFPDPEGRESRVTVAGCVRLETAGRGNRLAWQLGAALDDVNL